MITRRANDPSQWPRRPRIAEDREIERRVCAECWSEIVGEFCACNDRARAKQLKLATVGEPDPIAEPLALPHGPRFSVWRSSKGG